MARNDVGTLTFGQGSGLCVQPGNRRSAKAAGAFRPRANRPVLLPVARLSVAAARPAENEEEPYVVPHPICPQGLPLRLTAPSDDPARRPLSCSGADEWRRACLSVRVAAPCRARSCVAVDPNSKIATLGKGIKLPMMGGMPSMRGPAGANTGARRTSHTYPRVRALVVAATCSVARARVCVCVCIEGKGEGGTNVGKCCLTHPRRTPQPDPAGKMDPNFLAKLDGRGGASGDVDFEEDTTEADTERELNPQLDKDAAAKKVR